MNNLCNAINCTGIGEIQWMELQLAEIPHDERVDYADKNAKRLRDYYCNEICPVQKFQRRYGYPK